MKTYVEIPRDFLNKKPSNKLAANSLVEILQNELVFFLRILVFEIVSNLFSLLIYSHLFNRNIILVMIELIVDIQGKKPAGRVP